MRMLHLECVYVMLLCNYFTFAVAVAVGTVEHDVHLKSKIVCTLIYNCLQDTV